MTDSKNEQNIEDDGEIDNDAEMVKKKTTARRKPTKGVKRGKIPTKRKRGSFSIQW